MPFSIPEPPPLPKHLRQRHEAKKPEGPPNPSFKLGFGPVYFWPTVSVIISVVSLCLSVYTALNR